jgi:DNA-directed RNA polymerase subunit RPC12/RpoP
MKNLAGKIKNKRAKMTKIKCRECGNIYELDETKVTEDYLQCPYCSKITRSPFK